MSHDPPVPASATRTSLWETLVSVLLGHLHPWLALLIATGASLFYLGIFTTSSSGPLPPGPRPHFFVGNALHMPRKNRAEVLASWKKIYGDVVYLRIFNREFVVLNSAKTVIDLFDQRGVLYSDKPHLIMAGDLVGKRDTLLFLPYGEALKKHRKLLRNALEPRRAAEHFTMQAEETGILVGQLVANQGDFVAHLRRHAGAIALRLAYGYQVTTGGQRDRLVDLAEEMAEVTRISSEPGRWLVDSFPWLRHVPSWFPGAGFKRWARGASKILDAFVTEPYVFAKNNKANGIGVGCFTHECLEMIEAETGRPVTPKDDEFLKWTAAGIYSGGSDTSVALGHAFIMYMITFPDVQRKAQIELDAVVGRARFATMDDRTRLPYIDALIKEVYRFRPITPLVPHTTLTDDNYRGYRIPRGSWIMANVWAIMHDSEEFPEPERFWPERFLDGGCKVDPRDYAFGFGRRRCPGYNFGDSTVFFVVTHLLAAFTMSAPTDVQGNKQLPPLTLSEGHICHPPIFRCDFTPREDISELFSGNH